MLFPEQVPPLYALLLFCLRTDQIGGIGVTVQSALLLQIIQQRSQLRPLIQGLVPVITLGDDINVHRIIQTNGCIHVAQQLLLLGSHIVDMVHVGVERCIQTIPAEDQRQEEDDPQQPTVTLRRS